MSEAMIDITREWKCNCVFDYMQKNREEIELKCRECGMEITATIVSVKKVA